MLAGELARAGGDHRRAFDAYEKRLRPFIEGKQASAAKFIWFFRHPNPIRPVVSQRCDAHDELRPAGDAVRRQRA